MPKAVSSINYLRAIQILFGEWKSISHTDLIQEDSNECIVKADNLSPEDMLIKQEAYQRLSEEAKEVIMMIVSSPNEILDMLMTPKKKLLTQKSIARYFKKIWMSEFITELTIKEIKQWVKNL